MKIKIEHLDYTITVKDPKSYKGEKDFVAMVVPNDFYGCTLYIKRPVEKRHLSTLAHELMHVLQFVAEERDIDMSSEKEHFGYLMEWLMNQIK